MGLGLSRLLGGLGGLDSLLSPSLLISLFSKRDRPNIIKRRGHGDEQNYETFLYGFMEYFHLNKNSSDKLGEFKFKLI